MLLVNVSVLQFCWILNCFNNIQMFLDDLLLTPYVTAFPMALSNIEWDYIKTFYPLVPAWMYDCEVSLYI